MTGVLHGGSSIARGHAPRAVAIASERVSLKQGEVYHLWCVRDLQNLVAAADLAASQAGKSTADEAFSPGTPIIAIPLNSHFEQEENAKALGFAQDDFKRLGSLIEGRFGKRSPSKNY
jgi:UDP-N-acetylglucosamine:LPS N-acetylglucosamine transferase